MQQKVLYYLGAGASAQALPLARSRWSETDKLKANPPRTVGLAYALKNFDFSTVLKRLAGRENEDYEGGISHWKENFSNLADRADEFGDVDTYAKYLHLMIPGGRELQKLKQTLAIFFSLQQLLLDSVDGRYLPWLVSIMSRKQFPANVKVLSWNYDFQLEIAASKIGNFEGVSHNGRTSGYSPASINHYPTLDATFSDFHSLSLIHLNGIAGYTKKSEMKISSVFQEERRNDSKRIVDFVTHEAFTPDLHFAWEKNPDQNDLIHHVLSIIKETTILVVIGYSFPFFNREYDKQIMKYLKESGYCRKIYYQDPTLNGEQLRAQFDLPGNDKLQIIHIDRTDNFHIPFEL